MSNINLSKDVKEKQDLNFSQEAINDLQKSGLNNETIKEAKITPATKLELERYKINWFDKKRREERFKSLYIIPYLITATDEGKFCRVKVIPTKPELFDGKYSQPPSQVLRDSTHLYILPSEFEKLKSPRCKLAIVEGEKKTLKLIQELRKLEKELPDYKVAVIGISGINNWQTAPEWKLLNLAGREIILFFDADSEHNKRVVEAELELAGFLFSKGAIVKSATWSVSEGKGIDDFLVNATDKQLDKLKGLLNSIIPVFEKYKNRMQDKELLRAFFKYPVRTDKARLEYLIEVVKQETTIKSKVINSIVRLMRIEFEEELQEKQQEQIKKVFNREHINIPNQFLWEEGFLKDAKGNIITKFFIVDRKITDLANEQVGIVLKFVNGKEIFLRTEELSKKSLTLVFNKNQIAMDEKTATKVLEYITQFDNVNYIPVQKIISQTGWYENNYYLPQTQKDLIFDSDLSGEFKACGSKEKELWLMNYLIFNNQHISLGYVFGFAATLINVLNTQNFVLFGQGETGKGKTTTFQLGLSLFGYYEKLKRNMNTTETGIEIFLDSRKDVLNLLDELNTSNKDVVRQVVKIIYDFENGKGRTRANKNLTIRDTATYRGILAISSEDSLSNLLQQTEKTVKGALRRVVIVDFSEFNKLDKETADIVYETIEEHYGNLIGDWIEFVKNNKEEVRKIYRNWIFELRNEDRGFRFNGQERHLAVLFTAADLIGKVFGVDTENLFNYLWQIAEHNHFEFANATELTKDRLVKKIEDFINENYNNFVVEGTTGLPNKLFGVISPAKELNGEIIKEEDIYLTSIGLKELAKYIQTTERELKRKLADYGFAEEDNNSLRIIKKTTIRLKPINKHISVYKISLSSSSLPF